jgi:hypothetical protein
VQEILTVQFFIPTTSVLRYYPNTLSYNQEPVTITNLMVNSSAIGINSTTLSTDDGGRIITINFNDSYSQNVEIMLSFDIEGILFSNSEIADTLNWIFTSDSTVGTIVLNVLLPQYDSPRMSVQAKPRDNVKLLTNTTVTFVKTLLAPDTLFECTVSVPSTCRIVDFDKQLSIGVGIGVSLGGVLLLITCLFVVAEIWNAKLKNE